METNWYMTYSCWHLTDPNPCVLLHRAVIACTTCYYPPHPHPLPPSFVCPSHLSAAISLWQATGFYEVLLVACATNAEWMFLDLAKLESFIIPSTLLFHKIFIIIWYLELFKPIYVVTELLLILHAPIASSGPARCSRTQDLSGKLSQSRIV